MKKHLMSKFPPDDFLSTFKANAKQLWPALLTTLFMFLPQLSQAERGPFNYSSFGIGIDIDQIEVGENGQEVTRQSTTASLSKDLGNGWYGLAGLGYSSYDDEVIDQNSKYRLTGNTFSVSAGIGRYFHLAHRLDLYGDTQLQHRQSESEIFTTSSLGTDKQTNDDSEIITYINTGLRWLADDSGRLEFNPAIGGYSGKEDSDSYAAMRVGWYLNRNARLVIGYTHWFGDDTRLVNYSLNYGF